MNFAQALRSSSRLEPSRTALLHGQRRVDYLALRMAAQRIATILTQGHGITGGARIALLLPDTPEFAFAAYGVLWGGNVLWALDPETEPDALADTLTVAEPRLLIGWHTIAEVVEELGATLGLDWLLVEPREFSRLLAATPPRAPLADLAGDAPALVLGAAPVLELGHADLAVRAREAAFETGLEPGTVIPAPASLCDPASQIRTLHAAVAAGAILSLAPRPVINGREAAWRSLDRL